MPRHTLSMQALNFTSARALVVQVGPFLRHMPCRPLSMQTFNFSNARALVAQVGPFLRHMPRHTLSMQTFNFTSARALIVQVGLFIFGITFGSVLAIICCTTIGSIDGIKYMVQLGTKGAKPERARQFSFVCARAQWALDVQAGPCWGFLATHAPPHLIRANL